MQLFLLSDARHKWVSSVRLFGSDMYKSQSLMTEFSCVVYVLVKFPDKHRKMVLDTLTITTHDFVNISLDSIS